MQISSRNIKACFPVISGQAKYKSLTLELMGKL
uniref:Uncharacterized protein n=1 Tax=Arundo donax TaxID=35708 RepID=A0A0A9HH99_ARUDO